MPDEPVNCGRCAHLWNREPNHPGFGRCACQARQDQTGKIRAMVELTATCEFAQLSAKFDPAFMPAVHAARRGDWPQPSILEPVQETPTTEIHSDETTGQVSL